MLAKNDVSDRQLVLVGGGHTHALLVRILAKDPIPGVKTILISDSYHVPYSGTLPGYLSGIYHFDESHIDLFRLCTWAGIEFVYGSVNGIDPGLRRINLKNYPDIAYDVLSIDIGSTPKMDGVPGAERFATAIKPVPQFLKVFDAMVQTLETGRLSNQSVVIVGGGAAGVEVALGLRQRLAPEHDIHLVHSKSEVMLDKPRAVQKKFHDILVSSGVKLHLGAPVEQVERHSLILNDRRLHHDFLFWMTQASPAPWLRATKLDLDQRGFITVRETLQTLSFDNIFATGDIASLQSEPRPKAGVFAVRQAKPLAENLRLVFSGAKARAFKPQKQFLAIVGTGDEKAVAMRGPFSGSGAWAWRLKVRIDRKFMRQFEELPSLGASTEGSFKKDQDCFSTVMRDPFLIGKITANHLANDMLVAGVVSHSLTLDLGLTVSGGCVAENQQTRLLAGIHSGLDRYSRELRIGSITKDENLSVIFKTNGEKVQDLLPQKNSLKHGDILLLTKPLGTGLILTAAAQLRAKGRWVEAAIQSMLKPGTSSFTLAQRYQLNAAAHVKGAGLLGLLAEMLCLNMRTGNNVALRLDLSSVPVMMGALECMRLGVESKDTAKNVADVHELVPVKPAKKNLEAFPILFDPQTAGGFLFSVPADECSALLKELHDQGDVHAAAIGRVEGTKEAQIFVE